MATNRGLDDVLALREGGQAVTVGDLFQISRSEKWMVKARCAQTDPEAFFPEKDSNQAHDAKKVCRECPVRRECLEFALRTNQIYGIWGALGPRDRQALRRMRRGQNNPAICVNGHDVTAVGLIPSGSCRQCYDDRQARYQERRKRGYTQPRKRSA